jgi:hypothetical protein
VELREQEERDKHGNKVRVFRLVGQMITTYSPNLYIMRKRLRGFAEAPRFTA